MKCSEGRLARQDGTEVQWCVQGEGEAHFLLFNGLGASLEFWGDVAQRLAALGTVIRFDLRGAGRTTLPTQPFSLRTLAEDGAAILDHLDVREAMLLGHAFGGRVAQVFARDFPSRTKAVVLCASGGGIPPLPSTEREVAARRDIDRDTWAQAWLTHYAGPGFAAIQPHRARALLDHLWEHRSRPSRVRMQMAAMVETAAESYWGQWQAPALLVYGSADRDAPPANAHDLANRVGSARVCIIEGAGHVIPWEAPELLVASIESFTDQLKTLSANQ